GMTTVACTESSSGAARALREAGMRGLIFQEVFGPDPTHAEDAVAALRRCTTELHAPDDDLVRIGISPHAPYTVSDRLYRMATELALEEGLPMAVHIAESRAERELVTRGAGDFEPGLRARGIATPTRGESSIELLDRLGVLRA